MIRRQVVVISALCLAGTAAVGCASAPQGGAGGGSDFANQASTIQMSVRSCYDATADGSSPYGSSLSVEFFNPTDTTFDSTRVTVDGPQLNLKGKAFGGEATDYGWGVKIPPGYSEATVEVEQVYDNFRLDCDSSWPAYLAIWDNDTSTALPPNPIP